MSPSNFSDVSSAIAQIPYDLNSAKPYDVNSAANSYNAQRVQELIQAAEEFLDSAEHAARQTHTRAFMENLFAAAELTAKAQLMMYPDQRLLDGKSHRLIGQKINLEGHLGKVDRDFVTLLNKLAQDRGTARYVAGKVELSPPQMNLMAATVRATLDAVKKNAPVRHSSK